MEGPSPPPPLRAGFQFLFHYAPATDHHKRESAKFTPFQVHPYLLRHTPDLVHLKLSFSRRGIPRGAGGDIKDEKKRDSF